MPQFFKCTIYKYFFFHKSNSKEPGFEMFNSYSIFKFLKFKYIRFIMNISNFFFTNSIPGIKGSKISWKINFVVIFF